MSPSSLRVKRPGGLATEPLYTRAHEQPAHPMAGFAPFVRGSTAASNRRGWEVRQRYSLMGHSGAGPVAGGRSVGAQIRADLTNGLDAPVLAGSAAANVDVLREVAEATLGRDLTASRPTPPVASATDARRSAMMHLAPGASVDDVAAFLSVAAEAGAAAGSLSSSAGLEAPQTSASSATDARPIHAAAARFVAEHLERWPNVRFASVTAAHLGFAGASPTTEVAGALAGGVSWLRALEMSGVDASRAAACLEFTLSGDADYFVNVAKLRALRWCWSKVLAACGAVDAAGSTRVASTTNLAMFAAATDVELNLLRATSAAFAAACGGADAISVEPADGAQLAWGWDSSFDGTEHELGAQLARNIQLVLAHEVGVHLVIDPAGGSWYAEDLTRQLAERSWQTFSDIEAANVDIGELLAADRDAAAADLAAGRTTMVGVNAFTFDDELRAPHEGQAEVRGTRWHEAGWLDLRRGASIERERVAAVAAAGPASTSAGNEVAA